MAGVGCGSPSRDSLPPEAMSLRCLVGMQTPGSAAVPVPPASPRGPSPRRCPQVLSWAQQQGERLQAQRASLAAEREEMAQLIDWITAAEEALSLRDQEPLPEEAEQLEELNAQHTVRDVPAGLAGHGHGDGDLPAWPAGAQPRRSALGVHGGAEPQAARC